MSPSEPPRRDPRPLAAAHQRGAPPIIAETLADGFLRRGARLFTEGSANHIMMPDVASFGLTGRQAEAALLDAGVITSRNCHRTRNSPRLKDCPSGILRIACQVVR
ncbi:hypothetical protein MSM1_16760 [Mycobacterium sp. SM1]|nr:hypothetical protein [Mycobacterium sp. SM1]